MAGQQDATSALLCIPSRFITRSHSTIRHAPRRPPTANHLHPSPPTTKMRLTSLYVAIVVASLRAIGSAADATTSENKIPPATVASLHLSETRSLRAGEKSGRNDLGEERGGFLSWITGCFKGASKIKAKPPKSILSGRHDETI